MVVCFILKDRTVLDGRTWCIDELPFNAPSGLIEDFNSDGVRNRKRPNPPVVVTQHLQYDRKFVIVNSKVCLVMTASLIKPTVAVLCSTVYFS